MSKVQDPTTKVRTGWCQYREHSAGFLGTRTKSSHRWTL